MKVSVTRESQLSAIGVQRIYKAHLITGQLVISWHGCEQGIRAFNGAETRNLLRFLLKYQDEIDKHPHPPIINE